MQEISSQVNAMAKEGIKGNRHCQSIFYSEENFLVNSTILTFEFLGLVGLADPVRPGVAEAVKECYAAGIKIVMITGDYPVTAQNIARQIGLKNADEVVTGSDLEKMSPSELQERIKSVSVFARVVPSRSSSS